MKFNGGRFVIIVTLSDDDPDTKLLSMGYDITGCRAKSADFIDGGRFVVGTANRLAALMKRKLSGLKLLAVMIDGVHFAEHMVLAAIGIDPKRHQTGAGAARRSDRTRRRARSCWST